MASEVTYCLCGQPYDVNKFMIECDMCKEWFHGSCVGIREYQSIDLDKYHCPRCEPTYGPSIFKEQTNWHRHNSSEPEADSKPVQTGTAVFIKELKTRHFTSADDVVIKLLGSELTVPYLQQNGFEEPILVEEKDGLDMVLPSSDFSVKDVEHHIGPDREIDVIDVTRQTDIRMKLSDFVEYYYSSLRSQILNVISLEFSNTGFSRLVEAPYIARALDWVNYVLPRELPEHMQRPEVSKYCLMGVKDSYTDFHVDFGGSSVWYHIHKGEKIFYLIKPTAANLSLYQRWMTSSTQSETFFGDQVDACYKCVMTQGQTMLIPNGWIHAVLTPMDSLVFGGNFLHSLNIQMQLQVYDIEKKIRTPGKFCFPSFETTNWYAARSLLQEMKDLNNRGRMLPNYLLSGVKALIITLKQWNQDKDYNKCRREQVPEDIESQKLLKELSKEVRHAERFLNSLNPPKPERESKRKKKKPFNKDFVDYSEPQNVVDAYESNNSLKLTIRTLPKSPRRFTPAPSSPVSRPPLKLTLPKPVMYPYSTSTLSANNQGSAILSENIDKTNRRPWSTFGDPQPHVKYKIEDELKVKISKHQDADIVTVSPKREPCFVLKLSSEKTMANDSIYDFHEESDEDKVDVCQLEKHEPSDADDEDDDEECLTIDEKPKSRKLLSPFIPFRMRLTNPGRNFQSGKLEPIVDMDIAGEVDVISDCPKNGIEELLKASGYTVEPGETNMRLDEMENVQASPSTKDAIAGMLSMSQACMGDNTSSNDETVSPRLRRRRLQFSDDYGENIDKVHQDEDYIYPTLDASDDDDLIFKPRGRRKMDDAWTPKARVGPLVPKTDRPMREGTKKQSVEKGLEAAAAKRAGMPLPKRPYNRRKVRIETEPVPSTSYANISTVNSSLLHSPQPLSLSSQSSLPQMVTPLPSPASSCGSHDFTQAKRPLDSKFRRRKKGMATPKQRLGKILKIHKMKF